MKPQQTNLSQDLQRNLEEFIRDHDFAKLYKEYIWGDDTWQNGFPNILNIEIKTTNIAKNNLLRSEDVLSVVKWGNLRNWQRVKCPETLTLTIYEEGSDTKVEKDPLVPLNKLQANIEGLGPTYLSKILRFANPSEFGAIDTRIVRVVGLGDTISKQQSWLSLKARNYGDGWYIPKNQSAWPKEYSKWINILKFFAHFLNSSGKLCPHPEEFPRNKLRKNSIWLCADVEMALFSYVSKHIDFKCV